MLSCHHRDVFTNFKPGAPYFRFSPGDASDVTSPVSSPVRKGLDSWRIRGIWLDYLPSYVIRNSLCPQGAVPGKWPLCWCFVAHLMSLGLDLLSSDFFVRVATILLPWTLTVGVFAYFYTLLKATLLLPLVALHLLILMLWTTFYYHTRLDSPSPVMILSEARLGRAFEGVRSCANSRGFPCMSCCSLLLNTGRVDRRDVAGPYSWLALWVVRSWFIDWSRLSLLERYLSQPGA